MAGSEENDYVRGRQEWAERYGEYVAAARYWRIVAAGAISLAVLNGGGWLYATGQQGIVPYVVEVDQLGREVAVGRADVASPADPRVIRSMLARWVVNARSVYQDLRAQRDMVESAYTLIPSTADSKRQLDDWYRANSPLERTETVEVRVTSVLQVSPETWRVEWEEIIDGSGRESYQATVTILVVPPDDEREAVVNPLGVYIQYFQWGVRL